VLVTQSSTRCCCAASAPLAERIVYDALAIIEEKTGAEPIATLKRAVDNVKPPLEVKSRRVGGATYQVPVEVRPAGPTPSPSAGSSASPARREKTMAERLANELLDAATASAPR
jgi:small subunit ribosomal protein S7